MEAAMKFLRFVWLFAVVVSATVLAQSNPVPLINQPLVPTSAAPGGSGFTLTVNGTGFVSGAVVNWNGGARATTFISSSRLTAAILASDIATASTASVTVANPGTRVTSNPAFFLVTNPSTSVAFSNADLFLGSLLSVTTADFNRDGTLDLAVGLNSFGVDILLGRGDGTFQSAVQYATGGTAQAVAAGDFNGDGKLDLAVATVQGVISVLLGNGDGTFQPHMDQTTSILGTFRVLTADFNRDGKLDLAVLTGGTTSVVYILRGNGHGTFRSPVGHVAGIYATALVTGDFNGDGKLDLAATSTETPSGHGGAIGVLLGNGDGSFRRPAFYRTGLNPQSVVTADLNGDGKLDLVTANGGQNTISVLLGNGDGTFQTKVAYVTGMNPLSLVASDFNGDGKLDVATGDLSRQTGKPDISILLGNGDGTFQPRLGFAEPAGSALVTGDFNGDGKLDLASASASAISILQQTGGGSR
jgi:hypothetical protein